MRHSIATYNLPNLINVHIIDMPAAKSVEAHYYFKAGFQYFTGEQQHVPHLLEHMLISAGGKLGSEEILTERLQNIGASANALTNHEYLEVLFKCPAAYLDETADLINSCIFDFKPTEDTLNKEKGIVVRELHEQFDGLDARLISYNLHRQFPQIHPEAWDQHFQNITEIDLKDIRTAFHTHIVNAPITIIIAGNKKSITKSDFLNNLESLRPVNTVTKSVKPLASKPQNAGIEPIHVHLGESSLVQLMFNMKGGRHSIQDRVAYNVASALLFDAPSAKLPQILRANGAIYSIDSALMNIADSDVYTVGIVAASKDLPRTVTEIFSQIQNQAFQKEPLDITSTKKFLCATLPEAVLSVEDAVAWYAVDILLERPPESPEAFMKAFDLVKPLAVQKALRTIFIDSALYGTIASNDAAFWVPKWAETLKKLRATTDQKSISDLSQTMIDSAANQRAEAPERTGCHWAAYYLMTYVALIILLVAPVAIDSHGMTTKIALLPHHVLTWAIPMYLVFIIAGILGYIKGARTWLAERIMILLNAVASVFFVYGLFHDLHGFNAVTLNHPTTLLLILPILFYLFATPFAAFSVIRLSLYDRFKRI